MNAPVLHSRVVFVLLLAVVVFVGCQPMIATVIAEVNEELDAESTEEPPATPPATATSEATEEATEAAAPPETVAPSPGDQIVITFAGEGDGVPLFPQPGEIEVAQMPAGTSLFVTEGHESAANGNWYHVRSEYGHGWVDVSNPEMFIADDLAPEYLETFHILGASSPDAEQAFAVRSYLLGDFEGMRESLQQTNLQDAQSWVLYDLSAIAYFRTRDYSAALENVTAALDLDAENLFLYHHLILANLSLGDLPAAQVALDEALILAPDGDGQWAQWNYDQGLIHVLGGDISAALDDFNTTLEIDPFHSEAWRYLGVLNGRTGNVDLGIENLTRSIEIDPAYATPLVDVGRLYVQQGDFDLAIQNFDQAIVVNPNAAGAYVELGVLQYRSNEFDAAVASFTTAIANDPTVPQAHYYRGLIYYYQTQYQDSVDDCTRETEVNPRYANAYWCVGNGYAALGQTQTAVDQYKLYISLTETPNAAVVEYVQQHDG